MAKLRYAKVAALVGGGSWIGYNTFIKRYPALEGATLADMISIAKSRGTPIPWSKIFQIALTGSVPA